MNVSNVVAPSGSTGSQPRIERFDPRRHDVSGFRCGEPSLDHYLKDRVFSDRRRRAAVLYVMVAAASSEASKPPLPVLGFYTINSVSIQKGRLPKRSQRRVGQYPDVPAALIGRLAIDTTFQGRRYGEALLAEALERITFLADEMAIALVVVHAISESAARFYTRFGFEPFEDNPLHLFYILESFVEGYDRQGQDV